MNDLLKAALDYARHGWPVFPCHINKKPLTPNGFKDATRSYSEIEHIWTHVHRLASIGIPTGKVSGFVVLDVDTVHGGYESLEELTNKHGELPDTPMVFTGGGGAHYYFKHPESYEVRNSAGKLGHGLDIRGNGGYVIAPPSSHLSGKMYDWELTSHPDDLPLAEVPDWLLALIVSPPERPQNPQEGIISRGAREDTLCRLGGSMRRQGASVEEMLAALTVMNETRCDPPLPVGDIQRIAKSMTRYAPEEDALNKTPFSDVYNGQLLVEEYGDVLRYCKDWGSWHTWTGTHWQKDRVNEIYDYAREVVSRLGHRMLDSGDSLGLKHATRSRSDRSLTAMIHQAGTMSVRVRPEDYDAQKWLLNCPNGTVNLKTGELLPHRQEDMITRCTPVAYDPLAVCPRWVAFLNQIMAPPEDCDDPDYTSSLVAFLQRAVGYSLIGEVQEKILLIPWGTGDNGKSTFIETLANTFGEGYAMRTPTEIFLSRREGTIPNDVALLKGVRFAYAAEPPQDRRLGEALVKELTGGDKVSARFMRGEFFEFQPECTLWMATNHKPPTRGTDRALWNRIKLVPFTVCIPPELQEKDLKRKLSEEAEGILSWAVTGAMAWQRDGLKEPKAVAAATSEYRDENDFVGAFITERCLIGDTYRKRSGELYNAFKAFSEEEGEKVISQKAFSMALVEKGFERHESHGRWFIGLTTATAEN